ncbi:unnamed protein product [Didymodactylos carnosus]|uniref:Uncharacterized protein n=1 Tax=Didymodactylos carnosus TaxID=1234261 RepID=A0A8S2D0W1_9BILA|nr:unnamed protein product [Didymodactylos carnosus]CAF3634342.1 unnamed protein product [Didymodactylos carnosus]
MKGAKEGIRVAGNGEAGGELYQLKEPTDLLLDKKNNSIIICDFGNRRVMEWSLQSGTSEGKAIINRVYCSGLAMNDEGALYVTDVNIHEVRLYARGSTTGMHVAGGKGQGDGSRQLNAPAHIAVDGKGTVYVSDTGNHRVMKWMKGAKEGIRVAGDGEAGIELYQLKEPTDLLLDKKNNSIIICDQGNGRVTRWPLQSGRTEGKTIIYEIYCSGLAMDDEGALYVTDLETREVRLYTKEYTESIVVASGNGKWDVLNLYNQPFSVAADGDGTVYVSDTDNHCVRKWMKGAEAGIIVAGFDVKRNQLNQLDAPTDVLLDKKTNSIIVCDKGNQRVVRWSLPSFTTIGEELIDNIDCVGLAMDDEGALYVTDVKKHEVRRYARGSTTGTRVAGANRGGDGLHQLNNSQNVAVDSEGTVYVSDTNNHRVMKWMKGAKEGIRVAGSGEAGGELYQLKEPTDLLLDKKNNSIIICDFGNRRVMEWSLQSGTSRGKTIINVYCLGLAMDDEGAIRVTDAEAREVRRYTKAYTESIVVADRNGELNDFYRLGVPHNVAVDSEGTVYVSDSRMRRVMKWMKGLGSGIIVAGFDVKRNQLNQLEAPTDLLLDEKIHSIIICDKGNQRVMRWSLRSGTTEGEEIIRLVDCGGFAMDDKGALYVIDVSRNEVRQYLKGCITGMIVAGGNGKGYGPHQLHRPEYIAVDSEGTVYVSDTYNYRVMKWMKGAKEGMIVAGRREHGTEAIPSFVPKGLVVDSKGTLYVADWGNGGVTRWRKGAEDGDIIIGGNGQGPGAHQLSRPVGLALDVYGNLYVSDLLNFRVQRFSRERVFDK